jgi:pimeloyl-ACP methyl ester carboxylesterase
MHPRVDFTRHYLVPPLLRAGYAVWAQRSRNVNNDLTTVHEQLLLDIAAAHSHLAELGFDSVVLVGNSGGASLYALYYQQAALDPGSRLTAAPSRLPVDLTVAMPKPHALVFLAPHAGQGDVMLHCIDPSVSDERDAGSVIRELDLFDPQNGFREPQQTSSYSEEFLSRYRAAQRDRVHRIDASMRDLLRRQAEWRRDGENGDAQARRRAQAGEFTTVYRTDADPRTVDLSLDPSSRDYGSIFGRRPDITNYGAIGFGRLTTPHAWLSTWSGLSTNATLRLTAPSITCPILLASYTADNSVFPSDVRAMEDALTTSDLTKIDIDADHFGYVIGTEERNPDAADAICAWLDGHT